MYGLTSDESDPVRPRADAEQARDVAHRGLFALNLTGHPSWRFGNVFSDDRRRGWPIDPIARTIIVFIAEVPADGKRLAFSSRPQLVRRLGPVPLRIPVDCSSSTA